MYVFGVQTATDHNAYEPRDIGQWEFYVLSKSDLEQGQVGQSLGLETLQRLSGGGTPWADLRNRVLEKADGQTVNTDPWW